MKSKPSIYVLRSLLFVFCIESTASAERENIIVSKDVNDDIELAELFDILLRPGFLIYRLDEQQWFIDSISHYLEVGNTFDGIFNGLDTYFDSDVEDRYRFMKVLLNCLMRYQAEVLSAS